MKMHRLKNYITKLFAVLTICFTTAAAWAQDDGGADLNVNINEGGGGWYTQPWVWIVGGAVFLLLLVALLRGGGNKD